MAGYKGGKVDTQLQRQTVTYLDHIDGAIDNYRWLDRELNSYLAFNRQINRQLDRCMIFKQHDYGQIDSALFFL